MSNLGNQELGDIILGADGELTTSYYGHGQSQAYILVPTVVGQAQAFISELYLDVWVTRSNLYTRELVQFTNCAYSATGGPSNGPYMETTSSFAETTLASYIFKPGTKVRIVVDVKTFSGGGSFLYYRTGGNTTAISNDGVATWATYDTGIITIGADGLLLFRSTYTVGIANLYIEIIGSPILSLFDTWIDGAGVITSGGTTMTNVTRQATGAPDGGPNLSTDGSGGPNTILTYSSLVPGDYIIRFNHKPVSGGQTTILAVVQSGTTTIALDNPVAYNYVYYMVTVGSDNSLVLRSTYTNEITDLRIYQVLPSGVGQAQASISASNIRYAHGQSQATILQTYNAYSQAQGTLLQVYNVHGQAQASIVNANYGSGQAQAQILATYFSYGQSQANILQIYYVHGQAQASIANTYFAHGQAQARITGLGLPTGQAQGTILQTYFVHGQTQSTILQTYNQHAQAQALIVQIQLVYSQAQAKINAFGVTQHGQAQAYLPVSITTTRKTGLARAKIKNTYRKYAQANALITSTVKNVYGQANALIDSITKVQSGQANAKIDNPSYYLVDTFTRSTSLGTVGTPDIGPDWTWFFEAADIADAQVDGSRLKITSAGTYKYFWITNPINQKNVNLYAEFTYSTTDYLEFQIRSTLNNGFISFWINSQGRWILIVDDVSGPSQQSALAYFPINDGKTYSIRFIAWETQVKVKLWETGTPEPEEWLITNDDAEMLLPGDFTLWMEIDGTGSQYFDNVNVTTASTFARGQAAALIAGSSQYYPTGQAQATILATSFAFGQAQARTTGYVQKFGQAQGYIFRPIGQAQARIRNTYGLVAQAQGYIIQIHRWFGQTQSSIKGIYNFPTGQAQAYISITRGYGQAQAWILTTYIKDTFTRVTAEGDPLGTPDIGPAYIVAPFFYEQAEIDGSVLRHNGVNEYDYVQGSSTISAMDAVSQIDFRLSSVNDWMLIELLLRTVGTSVYFGIAYDPGLNQMELSLGNSPLSIGYIAPLTANTWYTAKFYVYGDELKGKVWERANPEPSTWDIETYTTKVRYGAAIFYADIGENVPPTTTVELDNYFVQGLPPSTYYNKSGQALAMIERIGLQFAQAQASIKGTMAHGQVQAQIKLANRGHGQARARIKITERLQHGQAQGKVRFYYDAHGNAQALITKPQSFGQAQAQIFGAGAVRIGQAQAKILKAIVTYGHGQAMAYIKGPAFGQAAALIEGTKYLIRFNGYNLPGYAQQETIDSISRMKINNSVYVDGSLSQYMGLENKLLSLKMKVVDTTYIGVKLQAQKAATIVHSSRQFTKLYIQYWDRYFEALTKKISIAKTVGESMRTLDYDLEFEAKPWLTSDKVYTISGIGLIDTDIISRTLTNGGWTPANIRVTGTNVTISGYTETENFAGYISISGAVTDFEINSNEYSSTDNGVMYNADYVMFVGPGKTYFAINGATDCTISWQDRWYL